MIVPVIAIDGPSASGKGTIAKRCRGARLHYLESGALYRLVGLIALRQGLGDEASIASAAAGMDVYFRVTKFFLRTKRLACMFTTRRLAGRRPRWRACRQYGRRCSSASGRSPAAGPGGRRARYGTVVFPDAALKIFFLTASPEVRALRI